MMLLIRNQRWLLALWALVLLAEILINFLIHLAGYHWAQQAEKLRDSSFLSLVAIVIVTSLVVRIIQAEPLLGSHQVSTPTAQPKISLVTKVLFGLLVLLLPSLIPPLFDVLQFHGTAEAVVGVLGMQIYYSLLAVICVIWLATFTKTLFQFWGVIGLLFLTLTFLSPLMEQNPIMGSWDDPANAAVINTRLSLSYWVFFVGLALSFSTQHLLRHKHLSLIVGLCTVALAFSLFFWWPIAIPELSPAKMTKEQTKIPIEFASNWQDTLSWENRYDQARVAHAQLVPTGPSDELPVITQVEATFKPSSGPEINLDGGLKYGGYVFDNWDRLLQQLRALVPGLSIAQTAFYPENSHTQLFALDTNAQAKLKGETGTLILKVSGEMYKLRTKVALPLNSSVPQFDGSEMVRLAPNSDPAALEVWTVGYTNDEFAGRYLVYLMVDPAGLAGTIFQSTPGHSLNGQFWSKQDTGWSRFSTNLQLLIGSEKPRERDVLYIYDPVAGAAFESILTAPHFTFPANN